MKTAIYFLIQYSNPQVLVDLDNYNRKHHRRKIKVLEETPVPGIHFEYRGTNENFAAEMKKPPHSQKELDNV